MSIDYATRHRWQNRVRWSIASALDRLPWTCWTSLVSWALHSRPLFDRYGDGDVRQDRLCREPSETGRCYCSKIAVERVTR
jgi:hypothetical protein